MIRKFVLAVAAVAALGTAVPDRLDAGRGRPLAQGLSSSSSPRLPLAWSATASTASATTRACAARWVVNRYGETVLRVINVCY